MRRIAITALVHIVAGTASIAGAQTWPADDEWLVLYCGDRPAFDPLADEPGATNERDVVGDDAQPAAYIFGDADFVYFRLRVDSEPTTGTDLNPFGWAVEIDTDWDRTDYELLAMVDGIVSPDEVALWRNTVQQLPDDPADRPEEMIATYPATSHARAVLAAATFDSQFGGDDDFFVDWAIPFADLAGDVVLDTELLLTLGTSSSAQSIDADVMCHDGSRAGATLRVVWTEVVRPDGVIVIDTDGDGLSDDEEIVIGTRPDDPDTDGDGVPDGVEVRTGTDPTDQGGGGGGIRGGPAGCSVGHGAASWWSLLALALLALRRRRA